MCTVAIDSATGGIRLLRYVVSEDCGVMINPAVVEGQIAGARCRGSGRAARGLRLRRGRQPADDDLPRLPAAHGRRYPDARVRPHRNAGHDPGHHKGVGEGGAIGAPAAVANAVNDALALVGAFVGEAPFSPSRIVAALEAVGR